MKGLIPGMYPGIMKQMDMFFWHSKMTAALLRDCEDNMCFGIYFAIGKEFRKSDR